MEITASTRKRVPVPNFWQGVREAKESFRPALSSVWAYSSMGLIIGFGLLTISSLSGVIEVPSNWPFLAFLAGLQEGLKQIAHHLGIGFIVSSVAVFLYEWGAHYKKVIEVLGSYDRQIAVLSEVEGALRNSGELCGILHEQRDLITKEAEKRLGYSLDSVLKTKTGAERRKAAEIVKSLVSTMAGLDDKMRAGDQYFDVVVQVLDELKRNAESLRTLDDKNPKEFKVSSGAVLADAILAGQMQTMGEEATYDVVSDLSSWNDHLNKFREETKEAVLRRGITVRRLFNLVHEGPAHITQEDARKVIKRHLRDSDDWSGKGTGAYCLKVFGQTSLATVSLAQYDGAMRAHYGLFCYPAAQEAVRFEVRTRDLTDMQLIKDVRFIEESQELFDTMWEAGIGLDEFRVHHKLSKEMAISEIERRFVDFVVDELFGGREEKEALKQYVLRAIGQQASGHDEVVKVIDRLLIVLTQIRKDGLWEKCSSSRKSAMEHIDHECELLEEDYREEQREVRQ